MLYWLLGSLKYEAERPLTPVGAQQFHQIFINLLDFASTMNWTELYQSTNYDF